MSSALRNGHGDLQIDERERTRDDLQSAVLVQAAVLLGGEVFRRKADLVVVALAVGSALELQFDFQPVVGNWGGTSPIQRPVPGCIVYDGMMSSESSSSSSSSRQ